MGKVIKSKTQTRNDGPLLIRKTNLSFPLRWTNKSVKWSILFKNVYRQQSDYIHVHLKYKYVKNLQTNDRLILVQNKSLNSPIWKCRLTWCHWQCRCGLWIPDRTLRQSQCLALIGWGVVVCPRVWLYHHGYQKSGTFLNCNQKNILNISNQYSVIIYTYVQFYVDFVRYH